MDDWSSGVSSDPPSRRRVTGLLASQPGSRALLQAAIATVADAPPFAPMAQSSVSEGESARTGGAIAPDATASSNTSHHTTVLPSRESDPGNGGENTLSDAVFCLKKNHNCR